ncbi:hypothetical protein ACFL4T_12820 [candidate division KSB1 bacterium]
MKINHLILTAVFILLLFENPAAQDNIPLKTPEIRSSIGYSLFYVDPDVNLNLSGLTAEMRWNYHKKKQYLLNNPLFSTREITLGTSNVLFGNINANAVYLTYGHRYEFPGIYYGYGLAPFTYWIFSDKKEDPVTGFILNTGNRFYIYYVFGFKIPIKKSLLLTFDVKYNYTIKNIYIHNPFTLHKHDDIFHYFSFNFGLKAH